MNVVSTLPMQPTTQTGTFPLYASGRHHKVGPGLCSAVMVILIASCSLSVRAQSNWHLEAWSHRASVEILDVLDGSIDTAGVKVLCNGHSQPDGRDIRVFDAQGQPVPFQLGFHHPARYTLVSFRAAQPATGQQYFVYFGNANAKPAANHVRTPTAPGAGPPQADWIPRAGMTFSTWKRPPGDNPKTEQELAQLLATSPQAYGGRYQQRISDGHNPFGPSDYYLSVYRGWILIPESGTYKFCTASNEASFSFLDGKKLVHWPGRHTSERGARGEKNETVELAAGLHYLEYYHEEVMLKQVAFLGWSPPGAPAGHFSAIPESVYTKPHPATVVAYETRQGKQPRFEPDLVDSIWPGDRHEGQYTRVALRVSNAAAFSQSARFQWQFGDGQSATGTEVEHVYLSLGDYTVTLVANDTGTEQQASWPLEIYEIQHVTTDIKQGRPPEYAEIASHYDTATLDPASLKELVHLYAESDRPQDAMRVGQVFVDRFAATHPEWTPRVQRLMALASLKTGAAGVDQAIANFQASITDATPAAENIDSFAQLIALLGIEKQQPQQVPALLKQVEQTTRNSRTTAEVKAAYRRAINSAGDVALWNNQTQQARNYYRRVEAMRGQFIPSQVRAARVGAFPQAIRSYLAEANYGAALQVVDEWEDKFATEKVKGQTFFWRGAILSARQQYRDASRYLERSVILAVGAAFETEARWRLAASLQHLGREKESRLELARLVATGLNDTFTEQARQRLKEISQK